jgi:chromosome segregation ATPase
MTNNALALDRETLQESFHQWQAEQELLDAEWSESLAALVAFQSHLDAWQQELGQEREELQRARQEWERDRTLADKDREQSSAQAAAHLADARDKIAQLTEQLLSRTEELRDIDQHRAELSTELELARAQAKELAADLEEQRRTLEHERAASAEQSQHLRDLLDLHAERPSSRREEGDISSGAKAEPANAKPRKAAGNNGAVKRPTDSPVLGSIVAQFGKLQQQRASDRQSGKKSG